MAKVPCRCGPGQNVGIRHRDAIPVLEGGEQSPYTIPNALMTGSGMPTLYGLRNCSTCRMAVQELIGAGKDVTFVDVRESRLDSDVIDRFLQEFGGALVNRRSTTWRSLPDSRRQGAPADLIAKYPALMKRPVVVEGELATLGWNATARERHLGE